MLAMTLRGRAWLVVCVVCGALMFGAVSMTWAAEPALLRISRHEIGDRNALIADGVQLVAEMQGCFLALGDPEVVAELAGARGLEVQLVDPEPRRGELAVASIRAGASEAAFEGCAQVIWKEKDWVLLRGEELREAECLGSSRFFLRRLSLDPLRPAVPTPSEYAGLAGSAEDGSSEEVAADEGASAFELVTDPIVTEMVAAATDSFCRSHWLDVISTASTRYSRSSGCSDAAAHVYALFDSWGLSPTYQYHSSGYAPNVVGTLPGSDKADEIVVVIGHLDDLPSSGSAPGADDNASGSAMVLTLAEIMSDYQLSRTVRFITVTGEEQGLYGSEYAAAQAAAAGDSIYAVLNGDMIGWEGDGQPSVETLDLNYNSTSEWLGLLFEQAAAAYSTGCVVDAFSCASLVYSDHAPFWDEGWSAVCGITDNEGYCSHPGSYPYYHTSNDTYANCGSGAESFFGGAVRAYLATAAHLAEPVCTAPAAPTGLSASADGDNRIELSWTSAGTGLDYEVRRRPGGCSSEAPEALVDTTSATTLVDTAASGSVTYGYVVYAKDPSGGCLSDASGCVEASTTGACTEPPYFDGVASVTDGAQSTCTLTLAWSAPHQIFCGTSARYNVYRSTSSGFTPGAGTKVAALVDGLGYDDATTIEDGVTYYYVVRAVDTAVSAEDSNLVEASAAPSGPSSLGAWTDNAGDAGSAKLTPASPWAVRSSGGHSGPAVYSTGYYGNYTCAALTTPEITLGSSAQLVFWTHYDIESSWDKGQVELSVNGGQSWQRLEVSYPNYASYAYDECGLPKGYFFSGTNGTYAQYTASLAAWAGQTVMIRWRLSSDSWIDESGWWIDDISISPAGTSATCTPG